MTQAKYEIYPEIYSEIECEVDATQPHELSPFDENYEVVESQLHEVSLSDENNDVTISYSFLRDLLYTAVVGVRLVIMLLIAAATTASVPTATVATTQADDTLSGVSGVAALLTSLGAFWGRQGCKVDENNPHSDPLEP